MGRKTERRWTAHRWTWIDQEERPLFGSPDRSVAVDVWSCLNCGKESRVLGSREPKTAGCPGVRS